MSNTLIIIAIILFIALAVLIEHRLNRRRRDNDKKVVSAILEETKNELENSANEELSPTATGRQKVREMLDKTKPHDKAQSSTTNSAIKDTLVEQDLDEPPLPDPFASDINTKKG